MPFSLQLFLNADEPTVFLEWIDDAFGKYVGKDTAFARAKSSRGKGVIVTNLVMYLSTRGSLTPGEVIKPNIYL
jgi:hypothetical protein